MPHISSSFNFFSFFSNSGWGKHQLFLALYEFQWLFQLFLSGDFPAVSGSFLTCKHTDQYSDGDFGRTLCASPGFLLCSFILSTFIPSFVPLSTTLQVLAVLASLNSWFHPLHSGRPRLCFTLPYPPLRPGNPTASMSNLRLASLTCSHRQ